MIDGISSSPGLSFVNPAEVSGGQPISQSAPAGGWAQLGLGGDAGAPASVGAGQSLTWARSWADLSARMRDTGLDLERLGQRMSTPQGIDDLQMNLVDMLKVSKRMSETAVEFQLTSGLLSNTATSVNKLLTQQ